MIAALFVVVFVAAVLGACAYFDARADRRDEEAWAAKEDEFHRAWADSRAEAARWARPQVDDRLRRAWGQADQQPANVSTPAETRQAASLLASVSTRREG